MHRTLAKVTALAEVAKAYGLKVETTPPLLANGQAFGQPQMQIVPELAQVLQTAFQMEESEPQLAPVAGDQFVVFEVARIEEASAPPLAQVKDAAIAGWKRAQGAVLAKQAADRIMAKVRAGTPLAAAMAAENKLHDLGVIPITSSDALGMGRASEASTWLRVYDRLADKAGRQAPRRFPICSSDPTGSAQLY